MADIVTPSAFSPAAQPKAAESKPVEPVAPVKAAPPAEPPEVAKLKSDLAWAKRQADIIANKQKAQFAKEKEGFGAKLSRLAELEKQEANFKLNKSSYLKAKLGDDWYDQIVNEKINGGAPTADIVQAELAKMREEFDAARKADKEAIEKERQEANSAALHDARRQVVAESSRFWTAKGSEYPLIDGLGTPQQIGGELAARIERAYMASIEKDENGRVVVDGTAPSVHKIAEDWEGELVKLAERAASHAKYAARFGKVAPPLKSEAQPQRRTLSNDLTTSTPGQRPPPANQDEKRARAEAAYLAARKK